MTKMTLRTVLATVLLSGSVAAVTDADANGDGVLTIDEMQAVMPDITAESFSQMDTNADGALDSAEVKAAQTAGLMPS